jgi:hypothetical protein
MNTEGAVTNGKLQKPTKAKKLKKTAARSRTKIRAKRHSNAAPRQTDQTKLYRLAKKIDVEDVRSPILKVLVRVAQKRKNATIDELVKAAGKSLPTEAKNHRAVVAWRVRHSKLFVPSGHRAA